MTCLFLMLPFTVKGSDDPDIDEIGLAIQWTLYTQKLSSTLVPFEQTLAIRSIDGPPPPALRIRVIEMRLEFLMARAIKAKDENLERKTTECMRKWKEKIEPFEKGFEEFEKILGIKAPKDQSLGLRMQTLRALVYIEKAFQAPLPP